MEGFNATVFSYGQTGSGKTHTMMGNDDEPGIIPQAVKDIFEYIQNDPSREFLLRISYLEIYNETLKDLLARPAVSSAASGKAKELILREEKGRIVVQGLTEEIVKDPQGVVNCLRRGEEFRSVAGTDWNSRSSRSHCVFSMVSFQYHCQGKGFHADMQSSRLSSHDQKQPQLPVSLRNCPTLLLPVHCLRRYPRAKSESPS